MQLCSPQHWQTAVQNEYLPFNLGEEGNKVSRAAS